MSDKETSQSDEPKGTTNFELVELANLLKIPNFRGIFMYDTIPEKINERECGIINLNKSDKNDYGHWVLYYKDDKQKIYYCSYGSQIPENIKNYLGKNILTSNFQIQSFDSDICGLICILILYLLSKGYEFEDIILDLQNKY